MYQCVVTGTTATPQNLPPCTTREKKPNRRPLAMAKGAARRSLRKTSAVREAGVFPALLREQRVERGRILGVQC
jgi:hypothetical protein